MVVLRRRKGIEDPAEATKALDAAWNGSGSTQQPSVTATILPDGQVSVVARRGDARLDEHFEYALAMGKARHIHGEDNVERLGGDHYRFVTPEGATGTVQRLPGGGWAAAVGAAAEGFERMLGHTDRALADEVEGLPPPALSPRAMALRPRGEGDATEEERPAPPPVRSAKGTVGVLQDLFGR